MASEGQGYTVLIRPAAERDLKKLKNNQQVLRSIRQAISELGDDPRPHGMEHLGGKLYRVRDGDFRIVYEIDDPSRTVDVTRVKDRKDVYRH